MKDNIYYRNATDKSQCYFSINENRIDSNSTCVSEKNET
jgi:hypothetical protein